MIGEGGNKIILEQRFLQSTKVKVPLSKAFRKDDSYLDEVTGKMWEWQ